MRTALLAASALVLCAAAPAAQIIEADNGARFQIIRAGHASALIRDEDGHSFDLVFDCPGHRYGDPRGGTWHTMPSRSVIAKVGEVACK